MKRLVLLAVLLLFTSGCRDPFAPPGARALEPAVDFPTLWAETEQCSGLRGDLQRIHWYVVDSGNITGPDGHAHGGWWSSPHTIYLGGNWQITPQQRALIVKHEMLHDLTQSGAHGAVFDVCHIR